jgi:AcrR family transcriptional regulator
MCDKIGAQKNAAFVLPPRSTTTFIAVITMKKSAKKVSPSTNPRLTRDDWIAAALDTLIERGVERVKVLPLAKKLNVTRGSFYWHFKHRSELLDTLLEFWNQKNTRGLVTQAAKGNTSITDAVLGVFEIWTNEEKFDPKLDFAIREWARRSNRVRTIVEAADTERVEALKQMFSRAGYRETEAFIRARILYYMQIGYFALSVRESLEQRVGYARDYLYGFTGVEPDKEAVETFQKRALRGDFAPSNINQHRQK